MEEVFFSSVFRWGTKSQILHKLPWLVSRRLKLKPEKTSTIGSSDLLFVLEPLGRKQTSYKSFNTFFFFWKMIRSVKVKECGRIKLQREKSLSRLAESQFSYPWPFVEYRLRLKLHSLQEAETLLRKRKSSEIFDSHCGSALDIRIRRCPQC